VDEDREEVERAPARSDSYVRVCLVRAIARDGAQRRVVVTVVPLLQGLVVDSRVIVAAVLEVLPPKTLAWLV